MDKTSKYIKTVKATLVILIMILGGAFSSWAQDLTTQKEKDIRPVRSTFESALLIDNQSVMVPTKGTFEWDMQHRFGTVRNGYEDFFGLYASSNIRLGFSYVPIDNLAVGFGFTKNNILWDFSAKYAILKQSIEGGNPVSITAFSTMALDTRTEDNFINDADRLSYFHEVIFARKLNNIFSVQIAPSLSHFNAIAETMKNDHFALSFGARGKLGSTSSSSIIFELDQPLTAHDKNNPHPNLSLGYEVATSGHAFQIFIGNYKSIINQYNNVINGNDYLEGDFLIGFNITKFWVF